MGALAKASRASMKSMKMKIIISATSSDWCNVLDRAKSLENNAIYTSVDSRFLDLLAKVI